MTFTTKCGGVLLGAQCTNVNPIHSTTLHGAWQLTCINISPNRNMFPWSRWGVANIKLKQNWKWLGKAGFHLRGGGGFDRAPGYTPPPKGSISGTPKILLRLTPGPSGPDQKFGKK